MCYNIHIQGNEAEVLSQNPDQMKKLFTIVVLSAIIATIAYGVVNFGNKGIAYVNGDLATYQAHHKPVEKWYYEVQTASVTDGKMFAICTNLQPEIKEVKGGDIVVTTKKNGNLVELELPPANPKAALKKGPYFTVRVVDGVLITIYFTTLSDVIKHNLNT